MEPLAACCANGLPPLELDEEVRLQQENVQLFLCSSSSVDGCGGRLVITTRCGLLCRHNKALLHHTRLQQGDLDRRYWSGWLHGRLPVDIPPCDLPRCDRVLSAPQGPTNKHELLCANEPMHPKILPCNIGRSACQELRLGMLSASSRTMLHEDRTKLAAHMLARGPHS